ncbi:HNH endonuclease signature motif containing protein [Microbacterium sp.]|uniref:HNH endonuclease signature motif containing protein n=1 Tax=Microbacterium sp. TaxID=51671 RepID=UPI00261F1F36|nr:HNH endonuclease signature motif containing protein [Microbacterium sp.]
MTSIDIAPLDYASTLALQGEILDDCVDLGRQISALEAKRAERLALRLDLLAKERSLDPGSDEMAFRSMCAEYAAAAHVSPGTAGSHIAGAWALVRLFPATFAALSTGTISKRHADVIVDAAPNVTGHSDADQLREEYEQQLVPFAERDTAARTRTHARGVAAAVFPEGMAEQHRRGRSERSVTIKPDGDGMAVLTAILPELLAHAIHDRLTAMAGDVVKARPEGQRRPRQSVLDTFKAEREAAVRTEAPSEPAAPTDLEEAFHNSLLEPAPWETRAPGEPHSSELAPERTIDDADTDVTGPNTESDLFDSALGTDELFHESTPMHDGYGLIEHDTRTTDQLRADLLADLLLTTSPTSVTSTALESVKATVQVTISSTSLTGDDDAMAELNGHGPMTSDAARILAGHAGSWDRAFLDPRGMVTETDNYVPTASMKRYLRARDQHCRFPGCRAPVHRCQIDHNHDHALGGPTAVSNLALFCAGHHALKHPDVDERDRWTAKQLENGVILWTGPTGRTYTDEPPLHVMFA